MALKTGINIFAGAGFSILAKDKQDRTLPLASNLLAELNNEFGKNMCDLPRLCTILEKKEQLKFRAYLTERFTVTYVPSIYENLNLVKIKSIYTTNIDNLIPQIIAKNSLYFINDQRDNGESPDVNAINYLPLHGNVDSVSDTYIFDTASLANIYSNVPRIWNYVSHSVEKYPTLFIGYSLNDSSTLQALTSRNTFEDVQKEKWIILHNPTDDEIEYFETMNFNVIIADIKEFLEYLPHLCTSIENVENSAQNTLRELFKANLVPTSHKKQMVRPIVEFFKGMPPIWGDIMSNNIFKTSYFKIIQDAIYNPHKHTLVIGAPVSGKTTLIMQVAYQISGYDTKLIFNDLTKTKSEYILKILGEQKALIFIENFTDEVDAFIALSKAANINLVGIDRSHSFETVSNYFSEDHYQIINVTELSDNDVQEVYNMLPIEVKRDSLQKGKSDKYQRDSIFEFVIRNIKGENIKERYKSILAQMEEDDRDLAVFLILCAYMHYCRVPLSMEVAYSFFSNTYDYKYVYEIKEKLSDLLNEFEEEEAEFNIDYYYPRSFYIADIILRYSKTELLAEVMHGVVENVPQIQICSYNKFKKFAFDKELVLQAFPRWKDGVSFYEKAFLYDYKNPYVLQQGALYLAAKKQYQKAFDWIDRAKMMTNNKYFSIRNSHAIILFEANIDVPFSNETERMLDDSMNILHKCYENDQRKTFHAITFAEQAIRYFNKVNSEKTISYLVKAAKWLKEENQEKKWNYDIRRKLLNINEILDNIK